MGSLRRRLMDVIKRRSREARCYATCHLPHATTTPHCRHSGGAKSVDLFAVKRQKRLSRSIVNSTAAPATASWHWATRWVALLWAGGGINKARGSRSLHSTYLIIFQLQNVKPFQ